MRCRSIVVAVSAVMLAASSLLTGPAHAQSRNCVQYVREITAFDIAGDAWAWWHGAEGRYVRSRRPSPGAVLVFERTTSMRHGHVAVVEEVIDERVIRVRHANWAPAGGRKGRVSVEYVADVSPDNDWSIVRVEHRPSFSYGKPYATNGFILPMEEERRIAAKEKPSRKRMASRKGANRA